MLSQAGNAFLVGNVFFSGWKCNLQRRKLDHWKWTRGEDRDMAGLASSIQHHHMQKKISCDQVRMREIQGAIAVSAIFQMILGYAGLIGFLLRSISHFCPTFSAPFPNNYQVDHAVDDHPGGGDDWHLALRRGQLLFSGQLGNCHPVRSFSSTSSSL